MVKSLAEEIRGTSVGKNWTGQFVRRYKDLLKSGYLRNLDDLRVTAEYAPMFKHFFQLVLLFSLYSASLVTELC